MRTMLRILTTGLLSILILNGCGGGGGGVSGTGMPGSQGAAPPAVGSAASDQGGAIVTIADAPGDFLSYMVNVTSLKLGRADGTVIETVPNATQIDFAQLVNLSEVISAPQVPAGSYTSVQMTLDYANANIVVDNGSGGVTVPAANILNGATGAALVAPNTQMTLTLRLPSDRPLVITRGRVANLALDFNLAASDTVAPTGITSATPASGVTVTVNPVLTASLAPDTLRPTRVRGPLVSVSNSAGAMSYAVSIRPFYNAQGTQGQLQVGTTSTTTFTINGTSYTGGAGLTALAALPAGTLTYASGIFDTTSASFTASAVFAGTNPAGANLDSVEGTVTARNGDTLTVGNVLLIKHALIGAVFRRDIAVTVSAATAVSEDGMTGAFTAQDISVGQHVVIFGTASTQGSAVTLDAAQGSARLLTTSLSGLVVTAGSGTVTLNLQAIDAHDPSDFDFAGTGTSASTDATAALYAVGVPASLLATPPAAGTIMRFTGFVAPFGAAPPDFVAATSISYANTIAHARIAWRRPGVTAPFTAPLSATNAVLSVATLQGSADEFVRAGPIYLDAAVVASGLTLVPDASPSTSTRTSFAIEHGHSRMIDTFDTFADLIAALSTDLNGTTAVLEIDADGPYNGATGTMTTDRLVVLLND